MSPPFRWALPPPLFLPSLFFPLSFPLFTLAVLAFLSFAETNGIEGEN